MVHEILSCPVPATAFASMAACVAPTWEQRSIRDFASRVGYARRKLIAALGTENPRSTVLCSPLAEVLSDVRALLFEFLPDGPCVAVACGYWAAWAG